jgi:Fe-S-cluster containining protein
VPTVDDVYAALPEFTCKGLCWESCSYVGTFSAERRRMYVKGIQPPSILESPCKHLNFAGRCSIHPDRPLICRLYGMIERLRCPFGCEPVLSDEEGLRLMGMLEALS